MLVNLYINLKDIENYNNGKEVIAADSAGKSVILSSNNTISVGVDSLEITKVEDYESTGWVNGTFNKFYIRKNTVAGENSR